MMAIVAAILAIVVLAALYVARDALIRWIAHRETMRIDADYRAERETFERGVVEAHRDHVRRIIDLERRAATGVRRA